MGWLGGIDARIWQAVVAGAFLALGWWVNGWQNRREAAAAKRERLRDVHRALFAEIGATLANLESEAALEAHRDAVLARMCRDPEFVPFVPKEHGATVFRAIVGDIHVLPRVTIDPIVAYYSQLSAIETLVEDMRSPGFRRLAQERRQAVFADYIEMKRQAFAFGNHALRLIDLYARAGKAAAEAARADISNSAAGPSGR
jgi:hypothetical protein